jgi:thiol-disulfide isomerase/thioredoxin
MTHTTLHKMAFTSAGVVLTILLYALAVTHVHAFHLSARIRTHAGRVQRMSEESPPVPESVPIEDPSDVQARVRAALAAAVAASNITTSSNLASASVTIADASLSRRTNMAAALLSASLAVAFFGFQKTQAVSADPIGILRTMERDSLPIARAACNGKPTVIDFFADWCENCKQMAPTIKELEQKYANKINFVAIDGSDPANGELVETFRVDGIPHFALIDANREVKTALVGLVPKAIFSEELDALATAKPLPYEGYDAFEGESHRPLDSPGTFCKP